MQRITIKHNVGLLLLLIISLAACAENETPQTTASETAVAPTLPTALSATEPTTAPTATFIPPTATPQLAALVNGQPILLADYERELARYEQAQTALGKGLDNDYQTLVLDALIERELIRQAAAVTDITVTEAEVDEQLTALRAANGPAAFDSWLADNLWTEAEFRAALAVELLVEKVATAVTTDVPEAVEQVHARYIQVDDATLAQSLRDQIEAGSDFAFLAQQHSQDLITAPNGGDLGYFAPGSLLVPQVESAAFNLQPGETSDVIAVTDPDNGQTTYYLVQLIERDPNRPLTAELRTNLLQETFSTWLREQWDTAIVTRMVG